MSEKSLLLSAVASGNERASMSLALSLFSSRVRPKPRILSNFSSSARADMSWKSLVCQNCLLASQYVTVWYAM